MEVHIRKCDNCLVWLEKDQVLVTMLVVLRHYGSVACGSLYYLYLTRCGAHFF